MSESASNADSATPPACDNDGSDSDDDTFFEGKVSGVGSGCHDIRHESVSASVIRQVTCDYKECFFVFGTELVPTEKSRKHEGKASFYPVFRDEIFAEAKEVATTKTIRALIFDHVDDRMSDEVAAIISMFDLVQVIEFSEGITDIPRMTDKFFTPALCEALRTRRYLFSIDLRYRKFHFTKENVINAIKHTNNLQIITKMSDFTYDFLSSKFVCVQK